jgi:hypothetical protein
MTGASRRRREDRQREPGDHAGVTDDGHDWNERDEGDDDPGVPEPRTRSAAHFLSERLAVVTP